MSDRTPDPDGYDDAALLERLGRALGHDPDAVPPPERVAQVRAAAERLAADRAEQTVGTRRRFLVAGGIAAGVGGVGGLVGYLAGSGDQEPLAAAPPTEQVTFDGAADVTTSELINHTWGTELVIDLSGLEPGEDYQVVLQTTGGPVGAGSLHAVADVVMKCRFSAAPLRADVRAIEVVDAGGSTVLRSELPEV